MTYPPESELTADDRRARSRRLARAGVLGLSGAAALAAAGVGGASWYYAGRLTEPPGDEWPLVPRPEDRIRLVSINGERVVVAGRDAARPGVWGLSWEDGYARIGPVEDVTDAGVARHIQRLVGTPEEGTDALLDPYAYPPDPSLLDLPYEPVVYASPVGPTPAWLFPGSGSTWAIFVHGRSGRRHEAFRAIPTFVELGMPCLTIAYRNDPDAPRSPDGRSHLGDTEWEDVEAAVVHALDHGAREVVLVGYSMGGACVLNLLRLSPLRDHVRALVMEAPVLDWGPVLRHAARDRGVPSPVLPLLLPATMALARARVGIDWQRMRQLHGPPVIDRPTLLLHGAADPTVPVELADALAALHPEHITYERFGAAGHVRCWNVDPDRYKAALVTFLNRVG